MKALEVYAGTTYRSSVNRALLALIPRPGGMVLDVGCGDGANARELAEQGATVWGISASKSEADAAADACHEVIVADVENPLPETLPRDFDGIILSHVLEHLADPRNALRRLAEHVKPGGWLVAAVPNMAFWRVRLQFLMGNFRRENDGAMDRTHLQFWSWRTAGEVFQDTPFEVFETRPDSLVIDKLRWRKRMPSLAQLMDENCGSVLPNLFAWQTLFLAYRTTAA